MKASGDSHLRYLTTSKRTPLPRRRYRNSMRLIERTMRVGRTSSLVSSGPLPEDTRSKGMVFFAADRFALSAGLVPKPPHAPVSGFPRPLFPLHGILRGAPGIEPVGIGYNSSMADEPTGERPGPSPSEVVVHVAGKVFVSPSQHPVARWLINHIRLHQLRGPKKIQIDETPAGTVIIFPPRIDFPILFPWTKFFTRRE